MGGEREAIISTNPFNTDPNFTIGEKLLSIRTFGPSALLSAAYEYLLIVVPVGLYVALEATRKDRLAIFWTSPEWAIATVFLLFQGLTLYIRHLSRTGVRLSATKIGLLGLFSLIGTTTTLINAYRSLDEHDNTAVAIFIRLIFFVVVSCAFFLFVAAAHLYSMRKKEEKSGKTQD
jgi:hypothetical protein